MDWPLNYHSKGRRRLQPWTLTSLALLFAFLEPITAAAESSPPVADVEDLFKGKNYKIPVSPTTFHYHLSVIQPPWFSLLYSDERIHHHDHNGMRTTVVQIYKKSSQWH